MPRFFRSFLNAEFVFITFRELKIARANAGMNIDKIKFFPFRAKETNDNRHQLL